MKIKTIEEFWARVLALPYGQGSGPEILFRGVTDTSHELIPSLGRGTKAQVFGGIETLEDDLIREFQRLTVPIIEAPPKTEFEWLFLAQHYGLPTRLLDWTTNPLVGLFFATEGNDSVDGALYYLQHAVSDQYDLIDYRTADYKQGDGSIFAIQPDQKTVLFVRPRYSDERYVNQRSVFSCPADPFAALQLPAIEKLIVPAAFKSEIRRRLRVLGISTSYIYPGLAGVASEIKSIMFNPVASGHMQYITARMELKLG